MEALKREATIEKGKLVLEGLPITDGERVEVIVLVDTRRLKVASGDEIKGLRPGKGGAKGLIFISEDFDAPLPGMADYEP